MTFSDKKTLPELVEMLSQAEQQVKDGRTAPISETIESIRSSLLAQKESK